jgi:hypothetical protein
MKISAQFRLLPLIAAASMVSASTAVAARCPIVIDDAIVRPSPVPTARLLRQAVAVNSAAITAARLVRREVAENSAAITAARLVRRDVAVEPAPVTPAEPEPMAGPPLRRPPIIITTTTKAVVSAL